MARVNLEERLFGDARLNRLCRRLKWSIREALGCVSWLWHDSQERLRTEASFDDIADWVRAASDEEATAIVKALCEAEFITAVTENTFRIHGNEKHVAAHSQRLAAAKNAGLVNRERLTRSTERLTEKPISVNSMQGNAVQCNSIQFNSEKEECTELEAAPSSCSAIYEESPLAEFLSRAKIKPKTVALWVATYGDPGWIRQELYKAIAWLDANPKKAPKKRYAHFIGSWLGRGWEWHRRGIVSNKPAEKSWEEIYDEREKEKNGTAAL